MKSRRVVYRTCQLSFDEVNKNVIFRVCQPSCNEVDKIFRACQPSCNEVDKILGYVSFLVMKSTRFYGMSAFFGADFRRLTAYSSLH